MKTRPFLRVVTRDAWRAWLRRNHGAASEVWLIFAKAHTGWARLAYAESVEEALCFGWIDTTVRRLDEERFARRFTPRTNLRNWSAINLERFRRMEREGRMTDAGRAKRPANVGQPPRRIQTGDPVPPFIEKALAAHPAARRNFLALAPGYRRDYVRWIAEAKRPETRERRIKKAIRRLKANLKRPGPVAATDR